jgi:hypothetical protein
MYTLFLSLAMVGSPPVATSEPQAESDDKIICRSIMTVGSRIPDRTCRTKREWEQIQKANSEELEDRRNYSRGTQNSN